MCGRFYLDVEFEEILKHYFGITGDYPIDYEPREIFPSNQVPVVHRGKQTERAIHLMKWGFAPVYMNKLLINARAETVFEKKTFKEAFLRRRCLIPASGYYEWKDKNKHQIRVEGQKIISLAGIYDRFTDKTGQTYWAFSILTKAANDSVKSIHHRMPVILSPEMEKIWIAQHTEDQTPIFDVIQASNPSFIID